MQYFKNLKTINYDGNKVKNIMERFYVTLEDSAVFFYDTEKGKKDLYSISFELYGSEKYWWILALINNVNDTFFDMPLDDTTIYQISIDPEQQEATGSLDASTLYDSLIDINKDKKYIRAVRSNRINELYIEFKRSI